MIPQIVSGSSFVDRYLSIWYGFRERIAARVPVPKFVRVLGSLKTNFGTARTRASL
jgi:hypothetical protein